MLDLQVTKSSNYGKSRSPVRTELPKIESSPRQPHESEASLANSATELNNSAKESYLLNKVAAAMPLLPPLPSSSEASNASIDHAILKKQAGDSNGTAAVHKKLGSSI